MSTVSKGRCRSLKREHSVVPGQSWGSMSPGEQQEWLDLECDEVFCKPNKKRGRGIYKCSTKDATDSKEP